MTVLTVLQEDDPRLRTIALPVEAEDVPELMQLAKDLVDTMMSHGGVGIAAPQVGRRLRLIVVKLDTTSTVIFNPVIVRRSGRQLSSEGCLSVVRAKWYQQKVVRALKIRVEFLAPDGARKTFKASGGVAAVIQHEVDHLNGVLFTDYYRKQEKTDVGSARDLHEV